MTSRERILRACRREPVDRVPISTYELVGWNGKAWENGEPSYRRLMDAIREKTDCIYAAGLDWKGPPHPERHTETWTEGTSRLTRTVWRTPGGDLTTLQRVDPDVHTVWTLEHLLKTVDDIELYLSLPHEPPEPVMRRFYREQGELGERGVMMLSVSDPVCEAAELFEMGRFLVHAITEPDAIGRLLDAIHERQMVALRRILDNDVRDVIFRICGPEYATPPYLSPEYFRRFVTPYLTEIIAEIRKGGAFARTHCHGRIGRVLDQMVEAGSQGLDPVEPPPDGDITLGEVKGLYGDRLCLFGNIELRELETSDPDRIEHLVRTAIEEGAAGGGFVLMPTAAPINVPLSPRTEENYLRSIEAGLKYGSAGKGSRRS